MFLGVILNKLFKNAHVLGKELRLSYLRVYDYLGRITLVLGVLFWVVFRLMVVRW